MRYQTIDDHAGQLLDHVRRMSDPDVLGTSGGVSEKFCLRSITRKGMCSEECNSHKSLELWGSLKAIIYDGECAWATIWELREVYRNPLKCCVNVFFSDLRSPYNRGIPLVP
jgi:hypothetical protein